LERWKLRKEKGKKGGQRQNEEETARIAGSKE